MPNCHKQTNGYVDTLICEKRKSRISTMLSPLFSWILPSTSSSSSEEEVEEENLDIINTNNEPENDQKINVEDEESENFLSSSDVDDNIPVALAVPNSSSPAVTVAFPANDERNTVATTTTTTATTVVTRSKRQRTGNYAGMVRQYQRLWTKQDEMELLKGYLDYIKHHRRANNTLQNDVASLYDHVRLKLNVDFNRNQLVEKLRRLKRKHKVALEKGKDKEVPFRSPQEQAIFEISNKIWGIDDTIGQDALDGDDSGHTPESDYLAGNARLKPEEVDNSDEIDNRVPKRSRLVTDDDANRTNNPNNDDNSNIQVFIEETMKSCFSPLLKELLDEAQEEQITMPLCPAEVGDEEWRKRSMLELEVYLKRLELLQDQIKAKLEELRSS
ncbi:hypothetical protein RJT34_22870 [Clitoria ternatea]|uniref:Glabrous enhancer-binding protein-like DBD domain-containing protein n=1 Tax=Clitoria ternatea TaxID=43366 RepID=A0AAN9FMI5_CLITE